MFAHRYGQLDDLSVLAACVSRAPPARAPSPVTTVDPPPPSWRDEMASAERGSHCRVYLYGAWHTAVVTQVDDETIHCRYVHDDYLDAVPIGSPDLVCEPRPPTPRAIEPMPPTPLDAPPPSWRDAMTTPVAGARCRVYLFGEWHAAIVAEVDDEAVSFRYVHDDSFDSVPLGSPDLVCEPRPPSNPLRGVQRVGSRPSLYGRRSDRGGGA